MNHKIKRKWIAALRSGQYEQFRGYLSNLEETKFCAMGILVMKVGISHCQYPYKYSGNIVHMNDYRECSFSQIADWIEENIPDTMGA